MMHLDCEMAKSRLTLASCVYYPRVPYADTSLTTQTISNSIYFGESFHMTDSNRQLFSDYGLNFGLSKKIVV